MQGEEISQMYLTAAINCQLFGADGITVHPRPDERHIRYHDVLEIKPVITTEFNIEGYPSQGFIHLYFQSNPTRSHLFLMRTMQ